MPQVEKNAPGVFCWMELATSDQGGAKLFYTSLFGWTAQDNPMGPGEVYTMFQLAGKNAGAAYSMRPEESSGGVPPHWNLYIAVTNADQAAQSATELGARVLLQPFDVATYGRMAVIQDPQGAAFCIWQAKDHIGIQVKSEPGSLCWVDLYTPDQSGASKFYSQLFGWELPPGPFNYLHIKAGEEYVGGIPSSEHADPASEEYNPPLPPHWLAYIQVSSCDASTDRAKQLGAKVHHGPVSMENIGRFAVLGDPQGAAFALFEPAARQ